MENIVWFAWQERLCFIIPSLPESAVKTSARPVTILEDFLGRLFDSKRKGFESPSFMQAKLVLSYLTDDHRARPPVAFRLQIDFAARKAQAMDVEPVLLNFGLEAGDVCLDFVVPPSGTTTRGAPAQTPQQSQGCLPFSFLLRAVCFHVSHGCSKQTRVASSCNAMAEL
jgi:hypothetical protein